MGFFGSLLSGVGRFLSGGFGKFLTRTVSNVGKSAISSLSNSLRDGSDPISAMKSIGKTAAHSLGQQMLNKGFDTVRDFASNRMQQQFPEFVKPFESGAKKFKKRLSAGYSELLGQGGAQPRPMEKKMEGASPYPQGGTLTKE